MDAPLANPFRSTIVADPWHWSVPDVPEIHGDVFRRCCAAVEFVGSQRQSTGVLIHGEAGSGKTHLLARLRAALTQPARAGEPALPRTVFVALRMIATAPRMWRHLRNCLMEDLLRPVPDSSTQLRRLLLERLMAQRGDEGDFEAWWGWMDQERPDQIDRLLEEIDDQVQLGYGLRKAILLFLRGRRRADVKAYLRGESLTDEAYRELGLPSPQEGEDDWEEAARQAILAVCRLAGPGLPIVICYDQIEALRKDPEDLAGLFAFGRAASALCDQTSNTVQITVAQSTFLDMLNEELPKPDLARIAAFGKFSLDGLQMSYAERLVAARARSLDNPNSDPPPWLPKREQLAAIVGHRGCTPRELLSFCADKFDEWHYKSVSAPSVEVFLAETWAARFEASLQSVPLGQADAILADGLPSVVPLLGGKVRVLDSKGDVQLVLTTGDKVTQVSLCSQKMLASLASRLRRLLQGSRQADLAKLVVLRDSRLQIKPTATKTRQYLAELQQQGARFVRPSVEALAALKALQELLADAHAGDLAHRGETVGPGKVAEWLRENLPEALKEFVDELISLPAETVEDPKLLDDLRALVLARKVIDVAEAAKELGRPAEELCGWIAQRRDEFGLLDGPPAVAFQRIAGVV